jgi:pimeloyl-ACP methyl ester carboxylesterase
VDAELERWKAAGQYFDYLGFDVFYRVAGSGPTLLLIHGYPFNSWDWAPIWNALTAVHCYRTRHVGDGLLR